MTKAEEMALYDALVAGLPRDSYLHLFLRSLDVRSAVEWAMKNDFAEPDIHGLNLLTLQRQQELRILEEKKRVLLGEIANAESRIKILATIADEVETSAERMAGQARALRALKKHLPTTPAIYNFQVAASGRS